MFSWDNNQNKKIFQLCANSTYFWCRNSLFLSTADYSEAQINDIPRLFILFFSNEFPAPRDYLTSVTY